MHNLKDNSMLNQVLSSEELDEIAETRQSRNLNFKAVFNKNNKKKKRKETYAFYFLSYKGAKNAFSVSIFSVY